MISVNFLRERIREAHIRFEPKSKGTFQLEHDYSAQVHFTPDSKSALAVLEYKITDTDSNQIEIRVILEGWFSLDGVESGTDRKVVNTKCFEQLFPYMESYIKQMATMSGIVDLGIPKPKFDYGDIHMVKTSGIPS